MSINNTWSSFDAEIQCEEYYEKLYDTEVYIEDEEENDYEHEFEPGRVFVDMIALNP